MENKKITIIDIKEVNEKFVKDYLKDTKDQLKNNKVYIKMNSDNNGESNEVYTRLIEAEKLIIIREINQILNEYDKLTADLKFYEDKLKELEDGHKTNN
jgi:tetrahydromethanopterin S-methyltransferase subunit A